MPGQEIIEFIKDIAAEAGNICMSRQGTLSHAAIHAKGNPHDLVTDVDREVERFLRERISARFPDHGFFGEEYGITQPEAEYCWVIDPIDGTNSYIHDIAFYSISIALCRNGVSEYGVVYAPRLGEMFWAVRGAGAFLNGNPLAVSHCDKLSESMLATGFACLRAGLPKNNIPVVVSLLPEIMALRRCGSAALDLAYVAAGRFDGFWEFTLNLYDVAAGILLVREAGGMVTDFRGGDDCPKLGIVAGNASMHRLLLKRLDSAL